MLNTVKSSWNDLNWTYVLFAWYFTKASVTGVCSEPCQSLKMELFGKTVNKIMLLTISTKIYIPTRNLHPQKSLCLCRVLNTPLIQKYSEKQPSRGVLRKRYSENMQQIYRRTPLPKYDFNKVALQLGRSSVNLQHIFRPSFPKNISGHIRKVRRYKIDKVVATSTLCLTKSILQRKYFPDNLTNIV